jgi:hypothetical protein
MLDMTRPLLYFPRMIPHSRSRRWCQATGQDFPILATFAGVAVCFGETLLPKYFAIGRAFQIMFTLAQAIPLGLLVRYLVDRPRKPKQERRAPAQPVR